LRDIANVEAEVGDANLRDLEFEFARDFFEARLRDLNAVAPWWQRRCAVKAEVVGGGRICAPGLDARD
jgi:hypothetical protein